LPKWGNRSLSVIRTVTERPRILSELQTDQMSQLSQSGSQKVYWFIAVLHTGKA